MVFTLIQRYEVSVTASHKHLHELEPSVQRSDGVRRSAGTLYNTSFGHKFGFAEMYLHCRNPFSVIRIIRHGILLPKIDLWLGYGAGHLVLTSFEQQEMHTQG